MSDTSFDAIVIGSGAGGLTAAGRLALAGKRVLVLEALDRPGGRFSGYVKEGAVVATGAIAIEKNGPWWQIMDDLGVDHGITEAPVPLSMRIGKYEIKGGSMTWDFLFKNVTKAAAGLAEAMRRGDTANEQQTLRDWALQFTQNETLHQFVDNLAQQVFVVNADEVPAATFFQFLHKTGGYKKYGYASRGNRPIVDGIIEALRQRGSDVRLGWKVQRIEAQDGRVTGVTALSPEGRTVSFSAPAVISNAGPRNTARMVSHLPSAKAFEQRIGNVRWASITSMAVLSDKKLLDGKAAMSGFINVGPRLQISGNMSELCPGLAPEGKHLYYFMSVPKPSLDHVMDEALEVKLLTDDLRKAFKDFDKHARVIDVFHRYGVDMPGMHAGPGRAVSEVTPIAGLYEVGDGVTHVGGGTSTCAHSGDRVAHALLEGTLRG